MGGFFILKKFIKDILFPIQCAGCFKFDEILCSQCYKKLEIKKDLACPACGKVLNSLTVCKPCQENLYINGLIALSNYNDLMKDLIHKYKYNNVKEIENVFEKVAMESFSKFQKKLPKEIYLDCVIIPIPLHKKRYIERGFNQSERISLILAKILNIKVDANLVRRARNTDFQSMQSDKNKRVENIKNCFNVIKNNLPKAVILVDDVYTTGSTMNECAKVLKDNGVELIYGIVIARA